jgi:hypothetical protein
MNIHTYTCEYIGSKSKGSTPSRRATRSANTYGEGLRVWVKGLDGIG